jgi:predicted P-loop ATPase
MTDTTNPLIDALQPLVDRVRTDATAVRRPGQPAAWTTQPLTRDRLAQHLNGGPARGVCPIKAGESVTMVGLLDFDSHKGDVTWPAMSLVVGAVVDQLVLAWGMEPILFRSSGGQGVHLYLLWDEPQDAYSVRQFLKRVLLDCGLRDGTGGVQDRAVEVFPKQDHVADGKFGNMFVLPMAAKSELLELDDLADLLVGVGADRVAQCWASSPAVPVVERPVVVRAAREPGLPETELPVLWAALDAVDNTGDGLEYDRWRDLIYAVHWATGGSQEGLDRVEAWSSRSAKHVPGYAEAKVWSYADQHRAGGITAATLFKAASQAGWVNPATHAEPDDDGFGVEGAAAVRLEASPAAETAPPSRDLAVPAAGVAASRPDSWEQPTYSREKKTGVVIASVENAVKAIRDEWEVGMQVAHDTFRDEIMVAPAGAQNQWRNITDADIVRLRIKLEQKKFKSAPKELARDAMVLVADENQFDSARLWLDSVQTCWDGVRRVDTFLRDFFGCTDTPYTRAVSRYIWTAMAGRVISPGCQADMAPILEGDQGLRKTSALAAMVPDRMFFTEIDLSKDDDTLARLLRGSLVGEISELRGLQTKDQESIKAWISRRYEKWVPKFKEFSTVFPRRCVLFGTTNRTDLLVDETGNRRWLPVHVTRADVEGIDAAREQLWAEGAALFDGLVPGWDGGVAWRDAEELARAEHESYRRMDEWEAPIQAWLDGNDALDDTDGASAGRVRGDAPFAVLDVLCGALGMSVKEVDMKAQMRCGAVLRSLGYEKKDTRVGNAVLKRWARR